MTEASVEGKEMVGRNLAVVRQEENSMVERHETGGIPMKRTLCIVTSLLVLLLLLGPPGSVRAFQDEGTLRVGAQWALSTVVSVFGVNANALFSLAIDEINEAGGVKIGGKAVRIDKKVYDDACNAEQGLSVARRLASADQVLVSLGPTCSSVAEPVFGTLQKRLDDANDTGIQMPYFTDQAIKFGLAKISPWAFRNVGNEPEMYDFIFKHLREKYPDYKRVAVGYESDFAHSASTYKLAIKPAIEKHGWEEVAAEGWRWTDTEFGAQITKLRKANPDIVALAAHPFTTCGSLKEAKRQGLKPKLWVGLTSAASQETLNTCPKLVEEMILPTNFAAVTPKAKEVSEKAWEKYKGDTNLHTAPSYENVYVIKELAEKTNIDNRSETILQDRRKFRDALATIGTFRGLVGPITMHPEDHPVNPRDVTKPFILVTVKEGQFATWWAPPDFGK